MNKLTRVTAAALTSIVAVGVFAVPATAASAQSVESQVCAAVGPQRATVSDALQAAIGSLDQAEDALVAAKAALDTSSKATGTTGLAYIRALDDNVENNEEAALAAFEETAADLAADLTGFVDAVRDQTNGIKVTALNAALLNYLTGVCPPSA